MSDELINNLPLIAIVTPMATAFIAGLIKNKYLNIQRILAVCAVAVSFIATCLMIKPVLIDGRILTVWLGNWTPLKGQAYGIGMEVDALGLFLGLIITTASLLSIIYSIKYMSKDNGLDKYYVLFLLLVTSMVGFVYTGDLFNMYVMLEIMTFAAIALTAFRNGKAKSVEAAFKYIVTGSLGSSLVLLGTVLLYAETKTLNLAEITGILATAESRSTVVIMAFVTMIVGYAVKAFMVPCHTWPTDAHMAAPSSISMILSGVMSKTGVYAIIRLVFVIFGFNSNKPVGYLIIVWGVLTMVIGVSMALLQHDFKRLLAFHSVSQIGYIISALGIAVIESGAVQSLALTGALYHMINHAIFKGLLFLSAGAVLYATGTTDLDQVSGLGKKMPFTMAMFLFGAAAISGIPPFNGFSSKWMIYEAGLNGSCGIVSIIAAVVSAMTLASFIKVGHSAFFGPLKMEHNTVKEVPMLMRIPMGILAAGTVIFGLFPKYIVKNILFPAVKSILFIGTYITEVLGDRFAERFVVEKVTELKFQWSGVYNPTNFLLLFIILLLAVLVIVYFGVKDSGEKLIEYQEDKFDLGIFSKLKREGHITENTELGLMNNHKYDVFVGGEKGEDIKIGPNDLFWGLKHEFKGYFKTIQEAHSGNVNDYAMWIVAALAVVIVFSFIFI